MDTDTTPVFTVPADAELLTLTGEQLAALEVAGVAAGAPYAAMTPPFDDAAVSALSQVVADLRRVRAEIGRREAAAAQEETARQERVDQFAALTAQLAGGTEEPAGTDAEGAAAGGDARPVGGATTNPRVGVVATRAPAHQAPISPAIDFAAHVAASADAGPITLNGWDDVGKAAERRLAQYAGARGFAQHGIATFSRRFPRELMAGDMENAADALFAFATDERRLPGGSLVAAAGWCSPSQTIYDLCELEAADGLLDIPEIQITRGGLRFTPGPSFADIFGGAGYFHLTEGQVIANTVKPCMEIDCPPFTDSRLDVEGVCITGSLLQRRGYPELVERFSRGAMIAHMHKLSAFKIAQMVAGSTPVVPNGMPLDVSATSALLANVELAIIDIKYRNRMPLTATVEIVLPYWAKSVIRADLSRRNGVDMVNITDEVIDAFFTVRRARVQWVYNYQDAFSGLATGPGGAVPLTKLPTTVKFLAFPAGTWLGGTDDVIQLNTVYDSANLSTNRYTALFTEEGILVAQRCNGGSREYTSNLCGSGVTAAQVAYVCA